MIKAFVFVLVIFAVGVWAHDGHDGHDHALKKRHFVRPVVHQAPVHVRPVAPIRPVVVGPPVVFRPPGRILIRRPTVRIIRPRFLFNVRVMIVGRVDFEGFINHLLDILLRHRLIDVRTGGFFLSRLGFRGRGILARVRLVGFPLVRPGVVLAPQLVVRTIQRLFIRGHPVARNRLLASLKVIHGVRVTPDEIARILLEFILDNGLLAPEQAGQMTAKFGVRITVTTTQPPQPITVHLCRVTSLKVRAEALPKFIVKILEKLVAKSIIPVKTAVNILKTFSIPPSGFLAKYVGKPITSVTTIKVSGAPLPKAKFINVLIKELVNGELPQGEDPLAALARLLLELAIDNDVFTIDNVSTFTNTFGITIRVEKKPVPDDDDVFDLPEPDPETPEPEEDSDELPEKIPEPPVVIQPPPPPGPRPTLPAPVHTTESKTSFDVTISESINDDNAPFVNTVLELVVNKGIFSADVANSILATFDVKGGAKFAGNGAELNPTSIEALRIGGNGDASAKFLKALLKVYRDKLSRVAYPPSHFQLQTVKIVLELALDNEVIDYQAAANLLGQNGISAEIQGTELTTETDIEYDYGKR